MKQQAAHLFSKTIINKEHPEEKLKKAYE